MKQLALPRKRGEALDRCSFAGPAEPTEDAIDPDAPQCLSARGCCPFLFAGRGGLHERVRTPLVQAASAGLVQSGPAVGVS